MTTNREIGARFRSMPLYSFMGLNGSGLPKGEDDGYEHMWAVEDLGREDPVDELIRLPVDVPNRPMYHDMGWAGDSRFFIRKTALEHWAKLDERAYQLFGWRVRFTDIFRPRKLQLHGYEWAVGEVLKQHHADLTLDDVKEMSKRVLGGHEAERKLVFDIYEHARHLFCMMQPRRPWDTSLFPAGIEDVTIVGATNLGVSGLEVDDTFPAPHSTGAGADVEPIHAVTRRPINMGVPVDTQGITSWFGFFDPVVTTMIEPELRKRGLLSLRARQAFYRQEVERRPEFQEYLAACGVDVKDFLKPKGSHYRREVWKDICGNRRAFAAICALEGVEIYGGEWWHIEFDNRYGGVATRGHEPLVSGGSSVAIYRGQRCCAYGNATPLYARIIEYEQSDD